MSGASLTVASDPTVAPGDQRISERPRRRPESGPWGPAGFYSRTTRIFDTARHGVAQPVRLISPQGQRAARGAALLEVEGLWS